MVLNCGRSYTAKLVYCGNMLENATKAIEIVVSTVIAVAVVVDRNLKPWFKLYLEYVSQQCNKRVMSY